jgi:hypothetical protein
MGFQRWCLKLVRVIPAKPHDVSVLTKMPLQDTAKAILDAEDQRRRRIAEYDLLRRPVSQVDQVLQELEEIHLRGGIKVPAAMILRIDHLLQTLPADCRTEFPLRTTITRVMDNLYEVQDRLLSRKDRSRTLLQAQDIELERDEPIEEQAEVEGLPRLLAQG